MKLKNILQRREQLHKIIYTFPLRKDRSNDLIKEIINSAAMNNIIGDDLKNIWYPLVDPKGDIDKHILNSWHKTINPMVIGEIEVTNTSCRRLALAFGATGNVDYIDALRQICGRGQKKLEETTTIKNSVRLFALEEFKRMKNLWVEAAEILNKNRDDFLASGVRPEVADFSIFNQYSPSNFESSKLEIRN